MDAFAFTGEFFSQIAQREPQGYGKQWTQEMYPVLYAVGAEAGYVVRCQPFPFPQPNGAPVGDGEIQNRDFMYFQTPDTPDKADVEDYHQPCVIIEHEIAWNLYSKIHDFWNMCLFCARLRVFIGYCKNAEEAEGQARALRDIYDAGEIQQVSGGQTLILIAGDEWTNRTL
jgi:hypothetical protein